MRKRVFISVVAATVLVAMVFVASRLIPPYDTVPVLLLVEAVDSMGTVDRTVLVDVTLAGKPWHRHIHSGDYLTLNVSPGSYTIQCGAQGYHPYLETFRVESSDSEGYLVCTLHKMQSKGAP